MLEANNICFKINGKTIISEVDVCLCAGEFTALIGPNGAGKTTLFKILSGDITASRGTVRYNGKDIKALSSNALSQVRAVMPQHSSVSFPFTAWEVVELGTTNNIACAGSREIIEVMELLNIWHLRDRNYNLLSGGERQRVQLARVLVQIWKMQAYPRYLLLDEPISSMDISVQHLVLALLMDMKERNIGILAVLHDLSMVANYADKVVMMKSGSIQCQGAVSEVFRHPNLTNIFGYPIQVKKHDEGKGLMVHSLPYHFIQKSIQKAQ